MRRWREWGSTGPSSQRRSVIGLKVRIQASEETETVILIPRPGLTPFEALGSRIVFCQRLRPGELDRAQHRSDGQAGREGPGERVLSCLVTRESGAIRPVTREPGRL